MSFRKYDENGVYIRKNNVVLDCKKAIEQGEVVLVEQSHKDEVDINNIIARHGKDLIVQVQSLSEFVYDDVVGNDFQESMNALIRAKETFSNVPSKIRNQFDNDAAQFMDFVLNKENKEQLIEWGLAEREPIIEPVPVVVQTTEPVAETPPAETA